VIAGIVLAAGLSRRMGRRKLLLDLGGQPVIRRAVEGVAGWGLDEVVVVMPPEHADLAAALAGIAHRIAVNPTPETGQAGSVVAGVAALGPAVRAVLIALGDQPSVPRAVPLGLLGAYRAGSSPEVDEAIRLHPAFEAFLKQGKEESTSLNDGYMQLAQILGPAATEN